MNKLFKNIGPGPLIAAAFVGPGTVTVCSMAGANYGYQLIWAVIVSIIGTIILQSMAARLGLVTQKGLAENIRQVMNTPFKKRAAAGLIIAAILVGNAAYEAGNISGGGWGLHLLGLKLDFRIGNVTVGGVNLIVGAAAFLLLYISKYKSLEKIFISLVSVMSLSYIIAALLMQPDFMQILKGAFIPRIPKGGLVMIISLVGTTIVPYNLFLHASLVNEKWSDPSQLKYAYRDLVIAIVLGGLVSIAIIITSTELEVFKSTADFELFRNIEGVFGKYAHLFMSIGLFAAGITSAITAPLAAAYVARGMFGWPKDNTDWRFRGVWMLILLIGTLVSSFSFNPLVIIQFAQFANGLLLPVVAFFLLYAMNSRYIKKAYRNTRLQNVAGGLILFFTLFLGAKAVFKVIVWLIG